MNLRHKWAWRLTVVAFAGAVAASNVAQADTLPTFELEMADGTVNPSRIEVPAGKRVQIDIHNSGKRAVEFESHELRKEKVIAPGKKVSVVIAPLSPGEYKFFDDFHQSTQGVIVAK
jgi:heme/copper-type cytochrome/quinol oxidase subunit 2